MLSNSQAPAGAHPVLQTLAALRDKIAQPGGTVRRQILAAEITATERRAIRSLYHLG